MCRRTRQKYLTKDQNQHPIMASESSAADSQMPQGTTSTPATNAPLVASCHCGRVTLELPSAPTKINECHCSVCYKYGALWVYYPRKDVMVTVAATEKDASLKEYVRDDLKESGIAFCRCGHCGCMTHWWAVGKRTHTVKKMGVNARMLPEEVLNSFEGVERKIAYC